MPDTLLKIRDLSIQFSSDSTPLLDQVNFCLAKGEAVGLVGDSGAGKTTFAKALVGLLPSSCRILNGSVQFLQKELLLLSAKEWRNIRGGQVSVISQEPELALNPFIQVGKQIEEVLRAHSRFDGSTRVTKVQAMMRDVGLVDQGMYSAFPHELSGGQRQRVVIAQALIARPLLLIADEPTSALDTVTQAMVLRLLKDLKEKLELSVIFITHNHGLLKGLADRIVLLKNGHIDPGTVPNFCDSRELRPQTPLDVESNGGHLNATTLPLLSTRRLNKSYSRGRWPLPKYKVDALCDVELSIFPGRTLGLAGKSGSGKSTLAKCIAGLEKPDSGEIWFDGIDLGAMRGRELKRVRREIQIIFQHSATSLNPAFTALDAVAEPLSILGLPKNACYRKAEAIMGRLGLPGDSGQRSPLAFSGGQRQKLALARALVLKPKLLVLDEALVGLDIETQLEIASLLMALQYSEGFSYLFISHDLRMAAYLANTIAVLDQGRIVEIGTTTDVCKNPKSVQGQELVASMPELPGIPDRP